MQCYELLNTCVVSIDGCCFFILLSWRNKGSHFFGGELLWTGTLLSFTLFWRTQNPIHTSFNTHIKPYQFDESRLKHFTFTSYFPFPRKNYIHSFHFHTYFSFLASAKYSQVTIFLNLRKIGDLSGSVTQHIGQ